MDNDSCFAHSLPGRPKSEWQPLVFHLTNVAATAARFAAVFDSSDWGRLSGLWHDLGKHSLAFQQYLVQAQRDDSHARRGEVDHATAGAQHSALRFAENNPVAGRVLAYCIAGHHGGLTDWDTASDASLARRLDREKPEVAEALQRAPAELLAKACPAMPRLAPAGRPDECGLQAALFIRMLFSCLVDADFLDTERAMDGRRAAERDGGTADMARLEARLSEHLGSLPGQGKVNARRREVLAACRRAAPLAPGLFSLTVPTGGGKTLSSLAFALKHAQLHGLTRVIYSIPFTSIIEQNADCFRKALGEFASEAVLEHHSNFEPRSETTWSRLASENWDAPLVVTTNVQFFESLFASRTSHCRKLHNIARSIVILDEVQSLPVTLLTAALATLRELVRNYGCTVVLCTATQPAFEQRDGFEIGWSAGEVRQIVPQAAGLYAAMRRARVEYLGGATDGQVVERLAAVSQGLCIVNTRRHAAALYRGLAPAGSAFHLSAAMCPAHRSVALWQIRRRLKADLPCRLVSTQLIEAGVDIDFPVVYRAMAGLDSIAQAAGRCNREGRKLTGMTYVFEAEEPPPLGYLRETADTARELVGLYDDLLSPEAVEHYFRLHLWKRKNDWDRRRVMACFRLSGKGEPTCDFREAAARFRMIDQDMVGVIVPWGRRGRGLVKVLQDDPLGLRQDSDQRRQWRRRLNRALQRYTVQVPRWTADRLQAQGIVQAVCPEKLEGQYLVLEFTERYSNDLGLLSYDDPIDPERLCI